ncbi:MAG: DUF5654 family protein [Candidatus Berkelbacteria bacterium]
MKKTNLRSEFLKTMIQLATAAFGLVAALAWNGAIQGFIERFVTSGDGLKSKFIYAVIVTGIAVVVTYILGRMSQKAYNEENKS